MKKYLLLILALAILIPINYFLFKGNPGVAVEDAEEQVIENVTGINIDLNSNQQ